MGIKLLCAGLLLLTGCGNNIQLKGNKLESMNASRSATSYEKDGTLTKSGQTTVLAQGRTYTVSPYSSKQAMDFIAGLPQGAQVPIIYTGGTQSTTIVLENIRRR